MFIDRFLGRRPSHFQLNPIVKTYIISEAFLWSAWDLMLPIIAIFISQKVVGGNIQLAATGYSIYLITRVIFELVVGRVLQGSTIRRKLTIAILGISLLSFGYLGFAFANSITLVFLFYCLLGIGMGIAAPAKVSLFSTHLDKNKESSEWSFTDAVTFICMALSTALGGFIAAEYGFQKLFLIACIVNTLSVIPYFLYLSEKYKFFHIGE